MLLVLFMIDRLLLHDPATAADAVDTLNDELEGYSTSIINGVTLMLLDEIIVLATMVFV